MVKRIKYRDKIVDEFIESVKLTMKSQGISVAQLAIDAGVGRQYMYRILSGECTPTIAKAADIAEALGIRIELTIPK